jgi:hypothetical protein
MNINSFLIIFLSVWCSHCTQAHFQRKRSELTGWQSTLQVPHLDHAKDPHPTHNGNEHNWVSGTTTVSTSSSFNNDAATIPTPITTALPTSAIPLYIPLLNPDGKTRDVKVSYFGPANGGSTIYRVVIQGQETYFRECVYCCRFVNVVLHHLAGSGDRNSVRGCL